MQYAQPQNSYDGADITVYTVTGLLRANYFQVDNQNAAEFNARIGKATGWFRRNERGGLEINVNARHGGYIVGALNEEQEPLYGKCAAGIVSALLFPQAT